MKDLTETFEDIYKPHSALVIYESKMTKKAFVERYDFDNAYQPINPVRMDNKQIVSLAQIFNRTAGSQKSLWESKQLLPDNLIYMTGGETGYAIWHTRSQKVKLYFSEYLGIEDGIGAVPALLWKASKTNLKIYALENDLRPQEKTQLFHVPLFNIHKDHSVCMGTVDLDFSDVYNIAEFIASWERFFWNSKFSHLFYDNVFKSNVVQLWKDQIQKGLKFPKKALSPTRLTLKDIL